jgi:hypothetical protein
MPPFLHQLGRFLGLTCLLHPDSFSVDVVPRRLSFLLPAWFGGLPGAFYLATR